MTNKKMILLAILFINLFAISAVSAAENQTDDIFALDLETDDVSHVDNFESENNDVNNEKVSNQELLSNNESDGMLSLDDKDEILAYTYTYPRYNNYNVEISDTTIDCEDGGSLTMDITAANSNYYYRYYFDLNIYDLDNNQVISRSYSSIYSDSICTYSISPYYLNPGIYTVKIINYYDSGVMDTATLTVNYRNADDNSFYALNYLISGADAGSTISLNKDYLFDSKKSGISISKQLTIDGKGHSIDGADSARIFNVNANNVTLKNIVFKNCNFNDGSSSIGGSIYWSGLNGILKDCVFVNCTITSVNSYDNSYSYGGAVYWYGSNGKMDGCSFINCLASSTSSGGNSYAYGGAVYWAGSDGEMGNCSFTSCSADSTSSYGSSYSYAGAVYWKANDGTLKSSNFIDCLSKAYSSKYSSVNVYSYGGAIYWSGNNGVAENSRFTQCYSQADASYSSSTKRSGGAAICWSGVNGLIDKSYFNNNSKTENGVVYAEGDYLNVTSSLFLDNYRNAIYWTGSQGDIRNSILISSSTYYPVYSSTYDVSADYNWWGNVADDFDEKISLPSKIIFNNWLYLDIVPDSPLKVGQTGKIKFSLKNLVSDGYVSRYDCELPEIDIGMKTDEGIMKSAVMKNGAGEIGYTAVDTPNDVVDVNVNKIKKQLNITVIKGDSKIIAANLKTVYNGGKYLKVILNDKYGHVIKGAKLTVKLNGKTKSYVTDYNGEIKIATNKLTPKTYTAKITFNGDENYYKSAATVKITVIKAKPKLTFSKQTVYSNVKKKSVSVTLKDNLGPVKKVKLLLTVKGKTFTAKTNSNGVAVFKVTNLPKIGTYKATVKFAGNAKYNAVSKKSQVIVKKAPKYKIITISTKMSDSGERVTKTYDNFVIQTEKFQHAATTLCVFVIKNGNMLKRNDYTARFQYNEGGVWKWSPWSHGTQAAVYYKIADTIPNDVIVGNVQVKLKV